MMKISAKIIRRIYFVTIITISLLDVNKLCAQVKVGDNPNSINSASLMELETTNKGFVFPRVSLSTAASPSPLPAGLLVGTVVYNINTAFTGGVGLYIWSGSTWMAVTPSSLNSTDAWKLTGNSGINPANNFLGTTDNQPLLFKVNGQKSGIISPGFAAFGYQALNVNTGSFNSAFGNSALNKNTTGDGNSAFGNNVLFNNISGSYNTAAGSFSLLANTGSQSTAIGYSALRSNTSGDYNTATGFNALYNSTTGTGNVANGTSALNLNTTGSYNTAVGFSAGVTSNNLINASAIGASAKVTISNALVLGDSTSDIKVGIGTGTPTANLHVKGSVRFAGLTNGLLTTDAAGNLSTVSAASFGNNWSLTGNAGTNPAVNFLGTTDNQPLLFKINAQPAGKLDMSNASFGYLTLISNTANQNSAFGSYALRYNTSGIQNTAFGSVALTNNTTGLNNTAIGLGALSVNTTGNNNTAIGVGADVVSNNLTNATAIGNYAKVAISNALVLGDSASNIKVGIGTGSPTANLHVKGSVRFASLTNGLLTADAAGNLSAIPAATAANAWSLTGNSGTDSAVNFLGMTDVKPLIFKINNQRSGYISSLGTNTSFGYQNLSVNTSGINNAAIGYNALKSNTTGTYNTAIGATALQNNNTGGSNSAFGNASLQANTSGTNNSALGYGSLFFNTSGGFNTAMGYTALYANTTGNYNTATGMNALSGNTTGNNNVATGYLALRSNTVGYSNVATGVAALNSNVSGIRNTAIGDSALFNNTASYNVAAGTFSLYSNVTGNQNTAIGQAALYKGTSASNTVAAGAYSLYNTSTGNLNIGVGAYSLFNNTSGNNNAAIGDSSLYTNITGSNNSALGYKADVTSNALSNATAIGYNSKVAISNALVLGDSVNNVKVGIGTGTPTANLHVKGSVRFAGLTNGLITADAAGNLSTVSSASFSNNWSLTGNAGTNSALNFLGTTDNASLVFKVNGQKSGLISSGGTVTAFGYSSLANNTANNNTAFGSAAMASNTGGFKNAAFGDSALALNVDGLHNTAIGSFALNANSNGSFNTATGNYALYKNTSGLDNSAFGFYALEFNTTGSSNTAVGNGALDRNTSGKYNTSIGDGALSSNTTGNYNTAIGENADVTSNNLTNATAIGYNAKVALSNALVLGDSVSSIKVGIGTGTPTANLHVKGSVRFANLTNGLLTADAAGNLGTVSAASLGNNWSLMGNAGTDSTINFLGTTDARPLVLKVNGQKAGRIDYSTNANTVFGYQALNINTSGINNTGIGYQVLRANTSGVSNVAIGAGALYSNTTGSQNIAAGDSALYNNTTGGGNTAMGHGSLYSNQTGSGNTATGYLALYFNKANYNTAFGVQSLYSNTSGYNNTATGNGALLANTTGAHNTAFGNGALNANTINSGNTAVGDYALFVNALGDANTAIGANTMASNISGIYNTSVGYNSLNFNTTGSYNVAFGYNALTNSNPSNSNISGSHNTAIGNSTLGTNTTGSYNTAIGENADVTVNNLTNATAIGSNTKVAVSNAVVLGNNANVGIGTSSPGTNAKVEIVGSVAAVVSNYHFFDNATDGFITGNTVGRPYSLYTSSSIWCGGELDVTSDERTKINIAAAAPTNALSLINKLRVVHYNYKDAIAKGGSTITGFLAQEVEKVMPDAVNKNKGVVPDIYQNAVAIHYDSIAKTLTLTLKENPDVKAGDTLKLITDAGEQLAAVSSVAGNVITVGNWQQNSAWVFIYGKQVSDMRNLDYNKIFSTGIGAIQQLSKQNDDLRKDVDTLKAQVKMLMERHVETAIK